MRSILLTVLFSVAVSSCSRTDEGQSTSWSALKLQGNTLELIDGSEIETYRFGEEGVVAATYGKKGRAVVAPLFYWRVEDGVLIISELPRDQEVERLAEPKINGDVVTARRKSGSSVQYVLKKSNG